MLANLLKRGRVPASAFLQRSAFMSSMTDVPMGPPDAILGLNEAFQKDDDPRKINLGVGAYRGEDGKPFILDCVRKAEKMIYDQNANHEYAGITGVPEFIPVSLQFAYGDAGNALADKRVAATQALSGTGALRVAGDYFAKFLGEGTPIHVPNPTWGNHIPIFTNAGLDVQKYTYLDGKGTGLDFAGMAEDLSGLPDQSLVLLHACAHNPTGVDPTADQWKELADIFAKKGHHAFFDSAYQGFASGDADADAFAIRHFVDAGIPVACAQSFSKNFGLYGERVGCLSFVAPTSEEADRCISQLKIVIRPMYSNPPVYGARIVSTILNDPALSAQFYEECKGMADRIISMRSLLKDNLEGLGSTHDWSHVTDQIGMFCYSGLSKDQVEKMKGEHHIYMTADGRISMAGVTAAKAGYLAEAIHDVTK